MSDTPPPVADDLRQALAAQLRLQQRLLTDIRHTLDEPDPHFQDAFRRWEEQLSHLKWLFHRCERLLLHYLLVPEQHRPWKELPGPRIDHRPLLQAWQTPISHYFRLFHIDGTYRRLADPLNLTDEASTADVTTDLVAVCAMMDATSQSGSRVLDQIDDSQVEDLAFYHVVSPWKQRGLPALFDVLRWLHAYLSEYDAL